MLHVMTLTPFEIKNNKFNDKCHLMNWRELLITLNLINHLLNLLYFVHFFFMSMVFAELEILQKWKNTYWAEYIEIAPIP